MISKDSPALSNFQETLPPLDAAEAETLRRSIPLSALQKRRQSAFAAPESSVIMMVDDEPLNIEMIQAYLEDAGYSHFMRTSKSEEALAMMASRVPDVLLLDLVMPKVNGLQILQGMKDAPALAHVPVIVLTSTSDSKTKLQALEMGAMDFLAKPADPSELALRLRNTLAARAHQDFLSSHDQLTKLPNRVEYRDRLKEALESNGDRHEMAVLHIGVDRLAEINESLGRAVGDIILQRVARRLADCVDTEQGSELAGDEGGFPSCYRFDGDEFAVLVPHLESAELFAGFISKLLEAVSADYRVGEKKVFVSCSVGVAVYPRDGTDVGNLLSNAGTAMRQAKRSGRNTYDFYSPNRDANRSDLLRPTGDLRKAIARAELEILYKPKVEIHTGRLTGVDTVVRWNHPEHLTLGPEYVLQLAESSRTLLALGEWMFHALHRQAKEWQRQRLPVHPFGINLAFEQFQREQLGQLIDDAVKNGINAELLCLQMREASLVASPELNLAAMKKFKNLGVRLAIGNFGAGAFPLAYLRRYDIDELKLDASLLVNVGRDKDNATIAAGIIAMARSMKLTVVGTGIETPQQLAFLKNSGCHECEGALIGSPLSPDEFAKKWLRS